MTAADPDQAGDPTAKPASLEWIFRATVVWAAFTVISSAVLWWNKSWVRTSIVAANNRASAANRRDLSDASTLDSLVRSSVLLQIGIAVISGFVLIALAVFLRRGRPWARWVLLAFAAVLAVVGFPLGILGQLLPALAGSSAPVVYRLALGIAGLASLAVIIFCFWPDTRRYFAAQRGLTMAAGGGQGGMLGMLMGRRAAPPPEDTSATRTAWRPPPRERVEPPAADASSSASPATDASSPAAAEADAPPARPAKPRTATRPGSVRPKGGARSKSRQR